MALDNTLSTDFLRALNLDQTWNNTQIILKDDRLFLQLAQPFKHLPHFTPLFVSEEIVSEYIRESTLPQDQRGHSHKAKLQDLKDQILQALYPAFSELFSAFNSTVSQLSPKRTVSLGILIFIYDRIKRRTPLNSEDIESLLDLPFSDLISQIIQYPDVTLLVKRGITIKFGATKGLYLINPVLSQEFIFPAHTFEENLVVYDDVSTIIEQFKRQGHYDGFKFGYHHLFPHLAPHVIFTRTLLGLVKLIIASLKDGHDAFRPLNNVGVLTVFSSKQLCHALALSMANDTDMKMKMDTVLSDIPEQIFIKNTSLQKVISTGQVPITLTQYSSLPQEMIETIDTMSSYLVIPDDDLVANVLEVGEIDTTLGVYGPVWGKPVDISHVQMCTHDYHQLSSRYDMNLKWWHLSNSFMYVEGDPNLYPVDGPIEGRRYGNMKLDLSDMMTSLLHEQTQELLVHYLNRTGKQVDDTFDDEKYRSLVKNIVDAYVSNFQDANRVDFKPTLTTHEVNPSDFKLMSALLKLFGSSLWKMPTECDRSPVYVDCVGAITNSLSLWLAKVGFVVRDSGYESKYGAKNAFSTLTIERNSSFVISDIGFFGNIQDHMNNIEKSIMACVGLPQLEGALIKSQIIWDENYKRWKLIANDNGFSLCVMSPGPINAGSIEHYLILTPSSNPGADKVNVTNPFNHPIFDSMVLTSRFWGDKLSQLVSSSNFIDGEVQVLDNTSNPITLGIDALQQTVVPGVSKDPALALASGESDNFLVSKLMNSNGAVAITYREHKFYQRLRDNDMMRFDFKLPHSTSKKISYGLTNLFGVANKSTTQKALLHRLIYQTPVDGVVNVGCGRCRFDDVLYDRNEATLPIVLVDPSAVDSRNPAISTIKSKFNIQCWDAALEFLKSKNSNVAAILCMDTLYFKSAADTIALLKTFNDTKAPVIAFNTVVNYPDAPDLAWFGTTEGVWSGKLEFKNKDDFKQMRPPTKFYIPGSRDSLLDEINTHYPDFRPGFDIITNDKSEHNTIVQPDLEVSELINIGRGYPPAESVDLETVLNTLADYDVAIMYPEEQDIVYTLARAWDITGHTFTMGPTDYRHVLMFGVLKNYF